jgi:hypothetical protein
MFHSNTLERLADCELQWRIEFTACLLNKRRDTGARDEAKRAYDRAKNDLRKAPPLWGDVPAELPVVPNALEALFLAPAPATQAVSKMQDTVSRARSNLCSPLPNGDAG